MISTFSSLRKPKLNGLNGMACKEKWMDGKKIVLSIDTDKMHECFNQRLMILQNVLIEKCLLTKKALLKKVHYKVHKLYSISQKSTFVIAWKMVSFSLENWLELLITSIKCNFFLQIMTEMT